MFRVLYLQTKNAKSPAAYMGPQGAWLVRYGSTGLESNGLPISLLERAKRIDWPTWVAFTPNGGWIYHTSVLAYEKIPQGLVNALGDLSEDTANGQRLREDFSIVSISFGPHGSWVLIYDDEQTRFNDSTHNYTRVHRYLCDCNDEIRDALQGNIDNQREPKQFLFVGEGWLLLRGDNGFASEKIPSDLYKALDEARKNAPTISGVAVAPNGAWVVTIRRF